MTTEKKVVYQSSIIDGPSCHAATASLSLSVNHQIPDTSVETGRYATIGFFVQFQLSFGIPGNKFIHAVITGMNRERCEYSDWKLKGYFTRKSRLDFARHLNLPIDEKNNDSVGWFTFSANYNTSTRKGGIDIEYCDHRDQFSIPCCTKFD